MSAELEHIRQAQMDLPEIVMKELRSFGAGSTDTFLVAVSGGADSTALLLALERSLGGPDHITACHVDHGIRAGANREQRHVVRLCRNRGVEIVTGQLDSGELSVYRARYGSLEAGMRVLRYRFLRQVAVESGSNWILTGHTADDQAETVLFRVARGMNWRSFGGIPQRRGGIIRPLLGVSRETTRNFCNSMGVGTITDPSNFDEAYARNRIRIRVLPELECGFHKGISGLLWRLGCAAHRLSALEKGLMFNFMRAHGLDQQNPVDRRLLTSIPEILRERVVLDLMMGTLSEYPSQRLLKKVNEFTAAGRNGRLSLPGGFFLNLSYGQARIVEGTPVRGSSLPPEGLKLHIPGKVVLPGGAEAVVTRHSRLTTPGLYPGGRSVLLSRENLKEPLRVRNRRQGDRFRPLGMEGSKKLSDFMVDRRIPASVRDKIPVVVDAEGDILWVAGWEISQKTALEGKEGEEAISLALEVFQEDPDTPVKGDL